MTSAADAPGVGKGIHIAYYAKQVTKAGPHVYDLAVVVTAAVAICRVYFLRTTVRSISYTRASSRFSDLYLP